MRKKANYAFAVSRKTKNDACVNPEIAKYELINYLKENSHQLNLKSKKLVSDNYLSEVIKNLIKKRYKNNNILFNLAVLYFLQKEYIKSIKLYTKLLNYPAFNEVYLYRGVAYFNIGEFQLAESDFNNQILNTQSSQAIFTCAELLLYKYEYKSAINLFSKLTKDENFKFRSSVYLSVVNYINSEIELSIKNLELIGNFDLNIKDDAFKSFADLINKLISWRYHNPHFKMYAENSSKAINVIGDSHSLSANGLLVDINGHKYICRTKLIVGIQMHHLASNYSNKYKTSVIKIINGTPRNSIICISAGEIDTRFDFGFIPRIKDTKELDAKICNIVNVFVEFFRNIYINDYHIIFNGIPAPNENSLSSNVYLNSLRNSVIIKINKILKDKAIKCGFGFIDLYQLTINDSGHAKNEMSLDSIHLNPEAYSLAFSNYLTLPLKLK